jgi:hypothetical protein
MRVSTTDPTDTAGASLFIGLGRSRILAAARSGRKRMVAGSSAVTERAVKDEEMSGGTELG